MIGADVRTGASSRDAGTLDGEATGESVQGSLAGAVVEARRR